MKVIICGGGVVSTCLVHYLIENGATCIIVEKHEIGCAASGKAGGFLAKNWCKHTPLENFSLYSFNLHEKLANVFNGNKNYDYRKLSAYSLEISPEKNIKAATKFSSWINGSGVDPSQMQLIGSCDNVAQLHPFKFLHTLANSNKDKGAIYMEREEVIGLIFADDRSAVKGVMLSSGKNIYGDVIVIAMGPWSGKAIEWWKSIPSIYGQKAHSIRVKPSNPVPAEALFTEYKEYSPEFYPRPDGEVYICGMSESSVPSNKLLPPDNVTVTPGSCEKIKEIGDLVSSHIKNAELLCSQACYLPLTQDGLPVIGPLKGVLGLYIAAGHGCWGILNSPATGKVLADFITKGVSEIDIKAFDPNRFRL